MDKSQQYTNDINNQEIIERISYQLNNIIQYEISKHYDVSHKGKYDNLVDEIDYLLDEARNLVKNFKDERLNLNHIEAEGYLRAMITISNLVK